MWRIEAGAQVVDSNKQKSCNACDEKKMDKELAHVCLSIESSLILQALHHISVPLWTNMTLKRTSLLLCCIVQCTCFMAPICINAMRTI